MSAFLLAGCDSGGGGNDTSEVPVSYSNNIRASISVGELPRTLLLDSIPTNENTCSTEYLWSITFDTSNDGEVGDGDIVFEINEHKCPGEEERIVNIADLEAIALLYQGESSLYQVAVIDFEVNDNTLTFIADRTLIDDIGVISSQTQVFVQVYKFNASTFSISTDYLPDDYGSYTQSQDTSIIYDQLMDYWGEDDSVDISEVRVELFK